MSCYLVQEEDGVSRFTLEDESGFILLEECEEPPVGGDQVLMGDRRLYNERIRRHPVSEDEMWIIATILSES
jgi:hypothetical protein